MSLLMLNGELVPAEKAVVPALDQGFTHGLGLYETLKILDGAPVFFDEHIARLEKGLGTLHIDLPETRAQLAAQIVKVAAAAEIPNGACRVLVTGGPPQGRPTLLIHIEVRQFPTHHLRLVTYRALRSAADLKSKSFTTSHLAMQAAQAAGADDALFVDEGGRAHEATTANLFVATEGSLLTPPLDGAILPGVTRAKVQDLARADGIRVLERHLVADALGENDTVLLTSSVRGIVMAASLDGRALRQDEELLRRLQGLVRTAEAASIVHFRGSYL